MSISLQIQSNNRHNLRVILLPQLHFVVEAFLHSMQVLCTVLHDFCGPFQEKTLNLFVYSTITPWQVTNTHKFATKCWTIVSATFGVSIISGTSWKNAMRPCVNCMERTIRVSRCVHSVPISVTCVIAQERRGLRFRRLKIILVSTTVTQNQIFPSSSVAWVKTTWRN